MNHRHFSLLFCLSSIVLLMAACTPSTESLPVSDTKVINAGSSFGQTFTAQYDGLSAISILLAPTSTSNSGSLVFHLRNSPRSVNDLASYSLPISSFTQEQYYRFDFPIQINSQQKDYYLQVDIEAETQVQIFTAAADSYLDGALYEDQNPQEAQLIFHLDYDRKAYLLGLGKLTIKWVGILLVGVFAFILPGWALFSLIWRGWDELNWISKLGLSGGLSLAIYPILLLWTDLVGLHLGPIYAWFPPLASLIALVIKNRKSFIRFWQSFRHKRKFSPGLNITPATFVLADISFIFILGLIIISRMWVIRSIDVPLFGDSYQHTMLTQLIIDNGGLFDSWKPYADLATLTYHFGFHSAAAVFQWISGTSSPRAVLWTGQLINILAILSLYPLALKLTRNRWAGVVAMLVAGLLSFMPMTYVNWGRYTQLAGQVILPAAIWTSWSLLDRPYLQQIGPWGRNLINVRTLINDLGSYVIAWLALAGLALTHYRVLVWIILFFPAYLLITSQRKYFVQLMNRIFWIGIGGAILFIPWFIHVFLGEILNVFSIQITTPASEISQFTRQYNAIGNLLTYLPVLIWLLFIICLGLGIWKHKKELVIFALWWFLLILAANPHWIGLPGTGVISNFAVFIAFYIPAGLIIGSLVEWILQNPQPSVGNNESVENGKIKIHVIPGIALIIICGLGLWGLSQRDKDLQLSTYELVTRPDMRAMEWISSNTPPDARFLVNSFSAYGNSSIVGSDAGWWIPLLAGRQTTLPPLTYAAEKGIAPDYAQAVKEFHDEIFASGITSSKVLQLMKEQGIGYIYIGQRQGRINYSGPQILDPQVLINDQHFRVIYHEDRVWIFSISY